MYWWNAFKLAGDLREGRVEEKERFKYYLAYAVLAGSMVLVPSPYSPETSNTVSLISGPANLINTISGTFLCYRANRSGDNADFIGRMNCLSWPVGILVFVLFFTVGGLAALFIHVAFGIEFASNIVMDISISICSAVGAISFYCLLYKCVKLVAHPNETA